MGRHLFTILAAFFTAVQVNAQGVQLSENAEISILTIGPGDNLNDTFGHNAFRISDTTFDYIFDYGRFDFEAPNFYTEFAQGKLNYWMGVSYYDDFLNQYVFQNRWVKEHVLDLSQEEKQQFFDFLMDNAKPENKFYLYDFFYDNCATRIRDVAKDVLKDDITFNTPDNLEPKSFRELIHSHVSRNSWGSLGIDVALGSVIDKKARPQEYMFLPIYIHEFFTEATRSNGEPLVKETNVLFQNEDRETTANFFLSPLFVFGILALFVLWITYKDYSRKGRSKWLDISLFAISGISGVVLLLLWFATDHSATAFNYNLLWAFPLNLIVLGQLFKKEASAWFRKYIKLLVILLCLLTLHWMIGVQVFAIGLIPLLIAFGTRYIFLIKYFKQQIP